MGVSREKMIRGIEKESMSDKDIFSDPLFDDRYQPYTEQELIKLKSQRVLPLSQVQPIRRVVMIPHEIIHQKIVNNKIKITNMYTCVMLEMKTNQHNAVLSIAGNRRATWLTLHSYWSCKV